MLGLVRVSRVVGIPENYLYYCIWTQSWVRILLGSGIGLDIKFGCSGIKIPDRTQPLCIRWTTVLRWVSSKVKLCEDHLMSDFLARIISYNLIFLSFITTGCIATCGLWHHFVLSVYLFVYLFTCLVSKLFFKIHLILQIWIDPFHITYKASLGGSAFGVCFAWRFGDFCRFGDIFLFRQKA